jgi:hypothetical protein
MIPVLLLLLVGATITYSAVENGFPDYGEPKFSALSVNCDTDDETCSGNVCDWLEIVAFRGNFTTLATTRDFLTGRLAELTSNSSAMEFLRMPPSLFQKMIANYTNTACKDFQPRAAPFRPWHGVLDGRVDSENHKQIYGGSSTTSGIQVFNVHAPVPGAERYHSHQVLSIFIHYGFPPCQAGFTPDGKLEADSSYPACLSTITPSTPGELEVLFVGTQWLHANRMTKVMGYPLARNCPHDQAPHRYGTDRGFMARIFFPLGEATRPDVIYPPALPGSALGFDDSEL